VWEASRGGVAGLIGVGHRRWPSTISSWLTDDGGLVAVFFFVGKKVPIIGNGDLSLCTLRRIRPVGAARNITGIMEQLVGNPAAAFRFPARRARRGIEPARAAAAT